MGNVIINAPFSEKNIAAIKSVCDKHNYQTIVCTDNEQLLKKELPLAEIVIGDIPQDCFNCLNSLKYFGCTSAGTDKYDNRLPKGVVMANASGAFGDIISEYAIGGILCLYRKFVMYSEQMKKGDWNQSYKPRMLMGEKTLILGTGNIGSSIAEKLSAFGTAVIGISRSGINKNPKLFREVHTDAELSMYIPNADLIICCIPLTHETKGIISRKIISSMKPNAVVVNVGRGAVIDELALTEALYDGKIYGAVLDVFESEPLAADSSLRFLKNVVATPHISGKSFSHPHTEQIISDMYVERLKAYFHFKG